MATMKEKGKEAEMETEEKGKGKFDTSSASTSFTLPSRRKYFLTISSIAFAAGIGVGVVVAIRNSRRLRLEEIRAAAQEQAASETSKSGAIRANNVRTSPSSTAAAKEMNKAAFARIRSTSTSERHLGYGNQQTPSSNSSVFDAPGSAPPPSVLMRTARQASSERLAKERHVPSVEVSMDRASQASGREKAAAEDLPFGQQPGILGFKALGIATALVGIFAWAGIEVTYRVLGVKNRDELIEQLGNVIPASERGSRWLGPVGEAARRALGGAFDDPKKEKEEDVVIVDAHGEVDLNDVDGTLEQLENAVERGDTAGWFDVLSKRLNAERRKDLEERRKRIEAATALQEQQSI